jgi:hypothetical protein
LKPLEWISVGEARRFSSIFSALTIVILILTTLMSLDTIMWSAQQALFDGLGIGARHTATRVVLFVLMVVSSLFGSFTWMQNLAMHWSMWHAICRHTQRLTTRVRALAPSSDAEAQTCQQTTIADVSEVERIVYNAHQTSLYLITPFFVFVALNFLLTWTSFTSNTNSDLVGSAKPAQLIFQIAVLIVVLIGILAPPAMYAWLANRLRRAVRKQASRHTPRLNGLFLFALNATPNVSLVGVELTFQNLASLGAATFFLTYYQVWSGSKSAL